jgi:hypothetical protein
VYFLSQTQHVRCCFNTDQPIGAWNGTQWDFYLLDEFVTFEILRRVKPEKIF